MYIYESHTGGLYTTDHELSYKARYCETCNDSDFIIGCAETRKGAWLLLENMTDTFDRSLCDGCEHYKDYEYCGNECENAMRAGGYSYEYIQDFINDNWDK